MEFEVQREGHESHPTWIAADPEDVLDDLVGEVVIAQTRLGPRPAMVKGMLRTKDGVLCFVKFDYEKEMGSTCWLNLTSLSPL